MTAGTSKARKDRRLRAGNIGFIGDQGILSTGFHWFQDTEKGDDKKAEGQLPPDDRNHPSGREGALLIDGRTYQASEDIGDADAAVSVHVQHAAVVHIRQVVVVERVGVFDERGNAPGFVDGITQGD